MWGLLPNWGESLLRVQNTVFFFFFGHIRRNERARLPASITIWLQCHHTSQDTIKASTLVDHRIWLLFDFPPRGNKRGSLTWCRRLTLLICEMFGVSCLLRKTFWRSDRIAACQTLLTEKNRPAIVTGLTDCFWTAVTTRSCSDLVTLLKRFDRAFWMQFWIVASPEFLGIIILFLCQMGVKSQVRKWSVSQSVVLSRPASSRILFMGEGGDERQDLLVSSETRNQTPVRQPQLSLTGCGVDYSRWHFSLISTFKIRKLLY